MEGANGVQKWPTHTEVTNILIVLKTVTDHNVNGFKKPPDSRTEVFFMLSLSCCFVMLTFATDDK